MYTVHINGKLILIYNFIQLLFLFSNTEMQYGGTIIYNSVTYHDLQCSMNAIDTKHVEDKLNERFSETL